MNVQKRLIWIVTGLFWVLMGCSGSDEDANVETVSFHTQVAPILQATCGGAVSGCHDAAPYNANVEFDCRGWLTLKDASLGATYNSVQQGKDWRVGDPTGCPDQDLYYRLLNIDGWSCGPNPVKPSGGGGISKSFVVAGDPDQSYLIQRITLQTDPCHEMPDPPPPMPPEGSILQSELDLITQWIEEGAEDN